MGLRSVKKCNAPALRVACEPIEGMGTTLTLLGLGNALGTTALFSVVYGSFLQESFRIFLLGLHGGAVFAGAHGSKSAEVLLNVTELVKAPNRHWFLWKKLGVSIIEWILLTSACVVTWLGLSMAPVLAPALFVGMMGFNTVVHACSFVQNAYRYWRASGHDPLRQQYKKNMITEGLATVSSALLTIGTGLLMLAAAKGVVLIGAPIVVAATLGGLAIGAFLMVRGFVNTIKAYKNKKKQEIALSEGAPCNKNYRAYQDISAPTKTPSPNLVSSPAHNEDAALGLGSITSARASEKMPRGAKPQQPNEEKQQLLKSTPNTHFSFFKSVVSSNVLTNVYEKQEQKMRENQGKNALDDRDLLLGMLKKKITILRALEEKDSTQKKKRTEKREGLEALEELIGKSLPGDAAAQQNLEGHFEKLIEDWTQLQNRLRANRNFMASFFLEVSACTQILNLAQVYFEQVCITTKRPISTISSLQTECAMG